MDFLGNPIFQSIIGLIAIGIAWRVFKLQTQKKLLSIDKQNQNESVLNKSTVIVIGLVAGVIGAALGFLPFGYLHEFLGSLVNDMPGDTSVILFILAYGLPLPMIAAIVVLPLGGAIMGMIGANIGTKRHLKKRTDNDHIWSVAFWWGLIFGFFINLFVGFFNQ